MSFYRQNKLKNMFKSSLWKVIRKKKKTRTLWNISSNCFFLRDSWKTTRSLFYVVSEKKHIWRVWEGPLFLSYAYERTWAFSLLCSAHERSWAFSLPLVRACLKEVFFRRKINFNDLNSPKFPFQSKFYWQSKISVNQLGRIKVYYRKSAISRTKLQFNIQFTP